MTRNNDSLAYLLKSDGVLYVEVAVVLCIIQ